MELAPDAYAEGICNVAAGSEIESLVDHIDATIDELGANVPIGAEEHVKDLIEGWIDLRTAIVNRERENDESTTFGGDDNADDR